MQLNKYLKKYNNKINKVIIIKYHFSYQISKTEKEPIIPTVGYDTENNKLKLCNVKVNRYKLPRRVCDNIYQNASPFDIAIILLRNYPRKKRPPSSQRYIKLSQALQQNKLLTYPFKGHCPNTLQYLYHGTPHIKYHDIGL